jgi:tetratricopeptide (TPR) repeat protein
MRKSKKQTLVGIALVLFLVQGFLSSNVIHPRWTKNYRVGEASLASGLGADQAFLELLGFREFLAGMLWVRGDTFFETGNYDAVLPIIRLVTLLDPKNIDVYATGMWHIGYNFTDEDQRSDRRYLPTALALGKEGCNNNTETYELYYEEAWLWYHKIDDDYPEAVNWLDLAIHPEKRPNGPGKVPSDIPPARRNLLRNADERNGRPDQALNYLYDLQAQAQEQSRINPTFYENRNNLDTINGNIDTTLVRLVQRGYYAKEGKYYDQGDYDTKPPFDTGFSAKVTIAEPKVLKIEGTWNVLPVGTRIRVILRDAKLDNTIPGGMNWRDMATSVNLEPPKDETYMQDQLFVRNKHFSRRIDMSKDITMYPFRGDKYILEFYYNPRSAPPHIQDKFGWNGEGMTDANFLKTDIRTMFNKPVGSPDERCVYTTMELTKDQIMQTGAWLDKPVVLKTKNYKDSSLTRDSNDEVIMVPSLRSSSDQTKPKG